MNVFVISLGCPKNLTDTEVLMGQLAASGHKIIASEKEADFFIINTCAFLKAARDEVKETIKELKKYKKEIYLAGCYPVWCRRFSVPLKGVAGVIDTIGLHSYQIPRIKATPPWTAYIKISEGCDNKCSYCMIPIIRGKLKIRKTQDILEEAKQLAKKGVKEIIYIAQDTTAHPKLPDILQKTAKIKGIHWIRIMYANPAHITEKLIKIIKLEPKIVKYIDLPLQHISDKILKLMNRAQINGQGIRNLVERLRRKIPGIAIRTSFIVGFPTETEKDFEELFDFVKEMKFERVGCFKFSKEDGTPASKMRGQVPEKIKSYRFQKLMLLQKKVSKELNQNLVGKYLEVLYEGSGLARTPMDAPEIDCSVCLGNANLSPGEFAKIKITNSKSYELTGRLYCT